MPNAAGSGEDVIEGDCVILAFDPTNRSIDGAKKACAYYVSSMRPAGGNGVYSIMAAVVENSECPVVFLSCLDHPMTRVACVL